SPPCFASMHRARKKEGHAPRPLGFNAAAGDGMDSTFLAAFSAASRMNVVKDTPRRAAAAAIRDFVTGSTRTIISSVLAGLSGLVGSLMTVFIHCPAASVNTLAGNSGPGQGEEGGRVTAAPPPTKPRTLRGNRPDAVAADGDPRPHSPSRFSNFALH